MNHNLLLAFDGYKWGKPAYSVYNIKKKKFTHRQITNRNSIRRYKRRMKVINDFHAIKDNLPQSKNNPKKKRGIKERLEKANLKNGCLFDSYEEMEIRDILKQYTEKSLRW